MNTVEFANGDRMPVLGLGTWKSKPGEVGAAVEEAVRIGYRHFDCAFIYENEAEIGEALERVVAQGTVEREELWITSKLWNDRHAADDVLPALQATLADLRLDYVDLYLVHWPVALQKGVYMPKRGEQMIALEDLPLKDTWGGMQAARDAGLARHIGVSNFSSTKLRALTGNARLRPEVNQVELHPWLQQNELVATCRELDVAVTAYSPLGCAGPELLGDPVIASIAERLDVTPAEVLIAWAIQRGTSAIPKSVNPERMRQNFAAATLVLSPDDMGALAGLDRGHRFIDGAFWTLPDGPYSLANLWDE
jgi:alcohol dehydrogenase (NADP+)